MERNYVTVTPCIGQSGLGFGWGLVGWQSGRSDFDHRSGGRRFVF